MYYNRIIDQYLSEWASRPIHKPVLLRGARQVGKSTAVRHLGEQFKYFVGAIIRSVDAFGFDFVVLPKNRSASLNEVSAHVSTGAIEHVKLVYVNSLLTAINKMKENGFWICGTDAKGNTLAKDIDPNLSLAVIIGSEGFGMSKTLVNASDYLITIPMVGHVNSLNASVSCGIVLHDLCVKE